MEFRSHTLTDTHDSVSRDTFSTFTLRTLAVLLFVEGFSIIYKCFYIKYSHIFVIGELLISHPDIDLTRFLVHYWRNIHYSSLFIRITHPNRSNSSVSSLTY